jgi:hypothetical protein
MNFSLTVDSMKVSKYEAKKGDILFAPHQNLSQYLLDYKQ